MPAKRARGVEGVAGAEEAEGDDPGDAGGEGLLGPADRAVVAARRRECRYSAFPNWRAPSHSHAPVNALYDLIETEVVRHSDRCRFPARDSRWRTWSPEEASMGAVPFQDAKWCGRGTG